MAKNEEKKNVIEQPVNPLLINDPREIDAEEAEKLAGNSLTRPDREKTVEVPIEEYPGQLQEAHERALEEVKAEAKDAEEGPGLVVAGADLSGDAVVEREEAGESASGGEPKKRGK